jgi:prophage regulatory protein
MTTNAFPAAGRRLERLPAVELRSGFKKSWIYGAINAGDFPPPVKVGRVSVWPSDVIDAWIASQVGTAIPNT